LNVRCSCDRFLRTREGNEECVPLAIDLVAAMLFERVPQEVAMKLERVPIASRPQTLEQPGRPLDVREQQRHRPRRLRRHDTDYLSVGGPTQPASACDCAHRRALNLVKVLK
jgi:hypothetical protein